MEMEPWLYEMCCYSNTPEEVPTFFHVTQKAFPSNCNGENWRSLFCRAAKPSEAVFPPRVPVPSLSVLSYPNWRSTDRLADEGTTACFVLFFNKLSYEKEVNKRGNSFTFYLPWCQVAWRSCHKLQATRTMVTGHGSTFLNGKKCTERMFFKAIFIHIRSAEERAQYRYVLVCKLCGDYVSTRDKLGISWGGIDPFCLAPFLSDLRAAEFFLCLNNPTNCHYLFAVEQN